ncbi:MAG: hypothetical protein WCH60_08720 [Burkholderiales bacterium]
MFEFLGRGKSKANKSATDTGPSTMPQTVQLGPAQIDMVRMTLHGVLKLNGIPGTWIAGEIIPIHIPGQGEALLLQLEIRHWHDALALHAPAFEQAMLDGLRRFDPQADQTRYLFAWKFAPQCGCPHIHLPQPDFWQTSDHLLMTPVAAPPVTETPVAAPPKPPVTVSAAIPENDDGDDDGFAPTHFREDH